jgi:magnesium-transporting ATPase (P-type)
LIVSSKILMNSYKEIIKYICFCNLSQFAFCILSVVLLKKLPFTPLQIIWLNFGNVILNTMLLFLNREKFELELHKNHVIDKEILIDQRDKIIFFSVSIAILALVGFQFINTYGNSSAQTEIFIFYIFAPLIILHSRSFIKGMRINIFTLILIIVNLTILCIIYRIKLAHVEKINLFNIKIVIAMLFIEIVILFVAKLVNLFNDEKIIDI